MSRRGNCCDNAAIESCWGSGFSLRPHHPVRHRSHAYDQKGANENRGWNPSVRRRAVLFDGYVSSPCHFRSAHQDGLIATEPREIDRRRAAGQELGPLAGVPVVIKDPMDMAGFPTTAG